MPLLAYLQRIPHLTYLWYILHTQHMAFVQISVPLSKQGGPLKKWELLKKLIFLVKTFLHQQKMVEGPVQERGALYDNYEGMLHYLIGHLRCADGTYPPNGQGESAFNIFAGLKKLRWFYPQLNLACCMQWIRTLQVHASSYRPDIWLMVLLHALRGSWWSAFKSIPKFPPNTERGVDFLLDLTIQV